MKTLLCLVTKLWSTFFLALPLAFSLYTPLLESKEATSTSPQDATSSPYTVKFLGIKDPKILHAMEQTSNMLSLQDRPPTSSSALKRRIENERNRLVKSLHSFALYSAQISYEIDETCSPQEVRFLINPGPTYHFNMLHLEGDINIGLPEHLGIVPGEPAYPKKILDAEETLLLFLARAGFPYAHLQERNVIADQKEKTICVTFQIETGPQAFFGKTLVAGNTTVKEAFIRQHLLWNEGELFDPQKVNKTNFSLEATGLFSSVSITYPEEPPSPSDPIRLPLIITVHETKQRSIALGLQYSTQRGPGFTMEWEHRNFKGMGEKFSFDANILQYSQEAKLEYVLPRVFSPNQDLIWAVEAAHDETEGFEDTSLSFSGTFERKLSSKSSLSYGGMYKQLHVTGSDHNGDFSLLKAPFQWRWSNTKDLLDPKQGRLVYLKMEPTLELSKRSFGYLITHLSGSTYFPLFDKRLILASRVQIGSILGASQKKIPPSELLYAGSETTLRGYAYYTVSPLDKKHNPIGGRSLFVSSLEARWRASEKWGGVLFYDIGNVYRDSFPNFKGEMRQSLGTGLRYFTPVGPLRFDFAFPLNRRRKIDPPFQFYFSIGQAF